MRFLYMAVAVCCLQISYSQQAKYIINEEGDTILLGAHSFEELQKPPFNSWFVPGVDTAHFSKEEAHKLRNHIRDISIEIFMGTWCGDSRREVPGLYALLDYIRFPKEKIKLVFLDNADSAYKESPGHEEKGRYILRVPTVIASRQGKEIGRVIEHPKQSWAEDITAILTAQPYTPNYAGGYAWMRLTDTMSATALLQDSVALVARFKPIVKTRAELGTTGLIHELNGDTEKAFASYAINRILFPADARVLNSLARLYAIRGNTATAIDYYKQALTIEPELEAAKKGLEILTNQHH